MKKIISTILVCLLLVGSVLSLASCSKSISGKYHFNGISKDVTLEFGMFGKITVTETPIIGDQVVFEGKYKLNDAGDEITITIENEDANEYNGTFDFAKVTVNEEESITIGLYKYEKVK